MYLHFYRLAPLFLSHFKNEKIQVMRVCFIQGQEWQQNWVLKPGILAPYPVWGFFSSLGLTECFFCVRRYGKCFYMNNLRSKDNKSAYLPVSLRAINASAWSIAKAFRHDRAQSKYSIWKSNYCYSSRAISEVLLLLRPFDEMKKLQFKMVKTRNHFSW